MLVMSQFEEIVSYKFYNNNGRRQITKNILCITDCGPWWASKHLEALFKGGDQGKSWKLGINNFIFSQVFQKSTVGAEEQSAWPYRKAWFPLLNKSNLMMIWISIYLSV